MWNFLQSPKDIFPGMILLGTIVIFHWGFGEYLLTIKEFPLQWVMEPWPLFISSFISHIMMLGHFSIIVSWRGVLPNHKPRDNGATWLSLETLEVVSQYEPLYKLIISVILTQWRKYDIIIACQETDLLTDCWQGKPRDVSILNKV